MRVPFMDLSRQIAPLRQDIDRAIAECIDQTRFVQGKAVRAFESEYADALGVEHVVGCGSGTDALYLALRAVGIGPGDEVIVPAMTFAATAEAVLMVGAEPRFCDVQSDTGLMTPELAEAVCGDRTRAVIPVHLCGRLADLQGMAEFARARQLSLISDAAQAHLARRHGLNPEALSDVTCYSFYPGKNLGAFGDAGACTSNDGDLATAMARMRDHGRTDKYVHSSFGVNMRMDELQAEVLRIKLRSLPAWVVARRAAAARYRAALDGLGAVELPPEEADDAAHVFHLFAVHVPSRDDVRSKLRDLGVAAGVHYPIPLHQ